MSMNIQAQIDAAARMGGGIVQLPAGTFDVASLRIRSNVWLRGAGVDATTLRLRPGADEPVIITRSFAKYTGTDALNSEVNFKISDLTINGNKANCPGGNGYGIRIHGANFALDRLRIYDCSADGITSEWNGGGAPPNTPGMKHSMEARLTDIEIHHCGGNGIYWNGPHDSMWTNCIFWENGYAGVHLWIKASGTVIQGCHAWGADQDIAFLIVSSGTKMIGCTGEGAQVAQALILANDCEITGGVWFASGGGAGIYLGQSHPASIPVAGYMIRTKLMGFAPGQAIVYDNDAGLGWIEALIHHPSGAAESGAPHPSSKREIRVVGGGTGDVDT
jgi:hypothetical protein